MGVMGIRDGAGEWAACLMPALGQCSSIIAGRLSFGPSQGQRSEAGRACSTRLAPGLEPRRRAALDSEPLAADLDNVETILAGLAPEAQR